MLTLFISIVQPNRLSFDFFARPFFVGTDTVILESLFHSSLQEKDESNEQLRSQFF